MRCVAIARLQSSPARTPRSNRSPVLPRAPCSRTRYARREMVRWRSPCCEFARCCYLKTLTDCIHC